MNDSAKKVVDLPLSLSPLFSCVVNVGKCRHKRRKEEDGGEARRDVSFGEMAGQAQDGRNKMRIVFFLLPLGLQSTLGEQAEQPVFNGDCHPRWPFLPGSILPFLLPSRLQSRQPKKITPGELSASPPLEGWMVGYDSLSLFLFPLIRSSSGTHGMG